MGLNEMQTRDEAHALNVTASDASMKSEWETPMKEAPPDGGSRAWMMVVLVHFVLFNTWGLVQSFGAFQTYYETILPEKPSSIAWIGSIQIFLSFALGLPAGCATDAGYFQHVFTAGLVSQLLGIFMTSLSTKYYQLLLAQGICIGIGGGLQFVSTLSVLSTYFDKKRALALGIAAIGTSSGSLIMPAMIRQLLPKIGFAWTVRSLGLMIMTLGTAAGLGLRPRVPSKRVGPLVDLSALTEMNFVFYCAGIFLAFWGAYMPYYYVGSYARDVLEADYSTSISLLLVMSGAGVPGRVVPNIIADRYGGPLRISIGSALISGVILLCWTRVCTITGLYIFATFFGFFSSGINSLFPASLAALAPDMYKRGTRMGMGFVVAGFACLTGSPLGGTLIQTSEQGYFYAQLWAGASLILGSVSICISSTFLTNHEARRTFAVKETP